MKNEYKEGAVVLSGYLLYTYLLPLIMQTKTHFTLFPRMLTAQQCTSTYAAADALVNSGPRIRQLRKPDGAINSSSCKPYSLENSRILRVAFTVVVVQG